MSEETKISIRNLHKSFGSHNVLNGIDLDIKKGSSLVILGGSGTGKSVLIKTIIGLMHPDSGTIKVDEEEVSNLSSSKKFKLMDKYGFLFQGGALFDSLTVEDNITFLAEKKYNLTTKAKTELALSKLESVGLTERVLKLSPSELSGGMQKRVSLARAICTDPEIIFFDEPTTGLDPIMSNVINELIIKARQDLGATTITITHDINSAMMIGTEVAFIFQGKIMWHGSKEQLENSGNPYLHQFIHGHTTGPITE
jgi:phospholipid/cholesterol/gamma-HCH transport system ATP-binding protein